MTFANASNKNTNEIRNVTIRERHNSYGVISTVLALLIAIVYASESYDDWDSVVALVGLVFSMSFLIRVRDADVLERSLCSFLAGLSGLIFLVAVTSMLTEGQSAFSAWLDGNLLVGATTLAVILAAIGWGIRSWTK